ncbi:hypothetical protein B7R54_16230 [Subtercola boreus]|uniref:Integral membrane protein n=1 Tax=Subtercola boreus TaxID=120213 RepID=A0A3E0VMA7_9MICO|nr:hypothetical protein [Subtercola boreus]RFA10580.1 hypothetical protein B7R54_16230 [Subtercola boreus]TQL55875.1 hypothetical protein FB464_3449 [Subtercola boreus]
MLTDPSRAEPEHGGDGEAERWLRSRGLPWFVAPGQRALLLVARTAPFITLLSSYDLAGWMVDHTRISLDSGAPVAGFVLLVLTGFGLVVLFLAPALAFLCSSAWLSSSPRGMTVAGWMLLAYYVVVAPWLAGHPLADGSSPLESTGALLGTVRAAGTAALALTATGLGLGSLASWSLRSAIRQLRALGELTTRALPLLMLVVVVSFFSRTLWEVTNAMSTERLAGVVAFFVALGLFFIVPVTRRETVGLENTGPPLSRLEHLNVTTVLVLAQGFQVAIFSGLVCLFLTALGQIAFSGGLLDSWLGPGREPLELAGIRLPVDAALVKTAVFLSCVSSLNFLISATTTAAYRSAFYDPLFEDARQALEVRAGHRASAVGKIGPEIVAKRE